MKYQLHGFAANKPTSFVFHTSFSAVFVYLYSPRVYLL